MKKITIVSYKTETPKPVKREFETPVVTLVPQITEKTDKKGVKTTKVNSGTLCFNPVALTALNFKEGSEIVIAEIEGGLCIIEASKVKSVEATPKGLTKTGVVKISFKNYDRIMSGNGLKLDEAYYFELEECIADLPGEDNAKVFVFKPLERRAG